MDDLTQEFLVETNDSLQALDQDLVRLEQNPDDAEIIKNIFRVMHTVKGTCGFLGLQRLASVAHSAENVMDKIRDGAFKITPEITSLILEAIDRVKMLIGHLEEAGAEPEGEDSELISRLNQCAETGTAGGSSGSVAAAPTPAPAEKVSKTPDLDEEIDFDPIPAPGVEIASAAAPAVNISKTPDLDEEIDFDPIPAPGVVIAPAAAPVPAAKPVISEKAKTDAVAEGLKASEDGPKKSGAAAGASAGSAAGQSIRVNLDVLENLMQMVGELVLTRNQLLQLLRSNGGSNNGNFSRPMQRLNLITTELQEGVMKTRMQPIGNAWAKFPRLVRDLAVDLSKKIELKMIGAETDLDRQMLEAIKDPLTHMVRNSADHGIEKPADRVAKGKSEAGTVTLSAYHEGGHIIIKVADDGKGLDVERIKAKALANGLATEAELKTMSDKQVYQFVFRAGFSTAEKVTAVSGRGVGMDVVVSNIEKIGGTVELDSWAGKGSEFLIKLPLTLAIMPVLIFECAGENFAIPQIRVSEIVHAVKSSEENKKDDYVIEMINDSPVLRLRDRLLPLISLSGVLQLDRSSSSKHANENKSKVQSIESFVVVCEVGSQSVGIMVDKVFHTEEIVVKPVSESIKNLDVYSGCTILGDGSVIMILDPNGIIKTAGVEGAVENKKAAKEALIGEEGNIVSFLMFKGWGKTPKAVPLELVSRLEEVDCTKAEWSGNQRVVQYRGGLMRLVMPEPDVPIPDSGTHDAIVFADGDRVMGLIVENIVDIVKQEMDIKSLIGEKGLIGSIIINGQTTDVIDVSYFFSSVFKDWLGHQDANIKIGDINEAQKHILLVDDSPFFRKFMKPVLVVANYKVTTAENGLVALSILEQRAKDFDLVISDIDMPEMNGVEFLQKCRADKRFSSLPYIALTSHSEEDLGDDIKLFNAFVTKSDRDRLLTVIKDVLAEKERIAA